MFKRAASSAKLIRSGTPISARQDRDSVARTLNFGAAGFITKSEQRKVMLRALGLIFAEGVYIPHEILKCEESSPLKLS